MQPYFCRQSLTDGVEQFAVLVILEDPTIAVAVCHKKCAGGLGDSD